MRSTAASSSFRRATTTCAKGLRTRPYKPKEEPAAYLGELPPQDPAGAPRSTGRRQARRSSAVVKPPSGSPARRAVALGSGRARRADGGASKNVSAGDGRHHRDDLGGVRTFQRGGPEGNLGADAQQDCVLVADGVSEPDGILRGPRRRYRSGRSGKAISSG